MRIPSKPARHSKKTGYPEMPEIAEARARLVTIKAGAHVRHE